MITSIDECRKDLQTIETKVSEAKIQKAKLEERLEATEKELKSSRDELAKLLPEVTDVDAWINKSCKELTDGIAECKQVLGIK